ncbi:probable disease resistance protein At1g15890 [Arabidopsis lyrata subsp. lyrata]|uniref:probable disease resistance protein At1g15890 n=1 Tax=Arabidopsis lyrata subsp. lyrata TaxID=81972 RepID=UPI000A29B813|nr:probable disease resistance protein At1g15890 [Arabidopsis lyrata subsp. lyrata]|eukprot:XP_020869587.1 probable disease resistance protein At1g15890 [Arabidopsis lyrata subsp. lyrata]
MGNCLSFQISCDQTLNHVCGCLCGDGNYIKKLTQNLDELEDALEELVATRVDLSTSVRIEERNGLQRLAKVQLWLSNAEAIEYEARGLIPSRTTETERLFPVPVDQRPIKPTVGLDRMLDDTWNLFMKENVGTLGIYVSRNGRVAKIQEEIGKRLSIHNERWVQSEEEEKASDIHKILKKQKFVLLLDDIWSEVDLQKIGVPYPNEENYCKIAFTARSVEVRGCMMRANAEMHVPCLEPDDAWDLFQKQVGDITLNFHEDIPQLARKMATKCQVLPLALTVIGGAMSCKRTVHEWQIAMNSSYIKI